MTALFVTLALSGIVVFLCLTLVCLWSIDKTLEHMYNHLLDRDA